MAKGMKLTDMVRDAMAELGADAKPLAIQGFLKEKYGKEVSTTIISNYKSVMKKRESDAGRGPGRPRKAEAGAGRPKSSTNGSIQIQDLVAIRELVEKLGADSVRMLLDYVGK